MGIDNNTYRVTFEPFLNHLKPVHPTMNWKNLTMSKLESITFMKLSKRCLGVMPKMSVRSLDWNGQMLMMQRGLRGSFKVDLVRKH